MYFGATWLAIHQFHSLQAVNIIRILCIYFIGVNFLQVFASIYTSFQDIISTNIIDTARTYCTLAFTIFFRLTQSLTDQSQSITWIS